MRGLIGLRTEQRDRRRDGRAERIVVCLILAVFAGLGLAFSLVVPPFETPDEIYHFAFVRRLAQGGSLPVQTIEANGPWSHEGTQPPLYYFLAGRLTASLDQSDFDQLAVRNPYANLGNPLQPGNKNLMRYSARAWPLQGTNLALHIARWFSLALGTLSLYLIYRTARLALPGGRWSLLTLATSAAIPQFIFISASCTNDSIVILLSTATLYWLARLVARDGQDPVRPWEFFVLGILLGLAALSKLQALGLFILAAAVVLWLGFRYRSWKLVVAAGALILGPALAIAGWWYWRNHVLYGEWLGINRLLTINGLRDQPPSLRGYVGEMRGLRYSFWGLFGWFSILLPSWVYNVLDILTLVAGAGLLVRGLRAVRRAARQETPQAGFIRVRLLLAMWIILLIALMVYWASFAASSQGRLLFPGLAALVILMVLGLSTWSLPASLRWPSLAALLPAGLAMCSLYTLAVLLPASYRPLSPITAIPNDAQTVNAAYAAERLELLAVSVPHQRYKAGQTVPVTLYLRATGVSQADYPMFVQLLDQERRVLGNVTTFPGWGRFPTSLWQPGSIYADRYEVPVSGAFDPRSPLLAQVYAGFADPATLEPLAATTTGGKPFETIIAAVPVSPTARPDGFAGDLRPSAARFGDILRLRGYRCASAGGTSGEHLRVTLDWEVIGTPSDDYKAFLHLIGPDGSQTGVDGPPAAGRFPATYWQPGDRILSEFEVPVPAQDQPGSYKLWLGLYPATSRGAQRVPISASDGVVNDSQLLLCT
ncbi:MAG TPA: DUF2142 domain-containing protein [Anaerolineae bacterium]